MRIVFFGAGGTMALLPLQRVASSHEVLALVRPDPHSRALTRVKRWIRRLRTVRAVDDPVTTWARDAGIPVLSARHRSDERIVEALDKVRPDLICICTFPWVLDSRILATGRQGALNVHASLLPRHRGSDPLFWTYHEDDRETGVSVHAATAEADSGALLSQEAWGLPRGFNIMPLHDRMAHRGAALLTHVLSDLERGKARYVEQDDSRATCAPSPNRRATAIDYATWPAERAWHFLAGMYPMFLEPMCYEGMAIKYAGVSGFELDAHGPPAGTVEPSAEEWRLYCRDGFVRLTRGSDTEASRP